MFQVGADDRDAFHLGKARDSSALRFEPET
jgi:hypothetical protein